MLAEGSKTDVIQSWFIQKARHRNVTVFCLIQNLFADSKFLRTVSRNAKLLVIFRHIRDQTQVQVLGRQLGYPKDYFMECYDSATRNVDWGYLVCDCRNNQNEDFRLRNSLFTCDKECDIYGK